MENNEEKQCVFEFVLKIYIRISNSTELKPFLL